VRALRLGAAVALLAAAFALVVLAVDVLQWRQSMRSGDRTFSRTPAAAAWSPHTVLPRGLTRDLLGLGLPLRLRQDLQSFVAVKAAGSGFDNGLSESRSRGELEAQLAQLTAGGNHAIASTADNLLGILAFSDSTQSGPIAPAPVDQSVADFQAAVRLDPTDVDAKFNLERLLHELIAHGVRVGPDASAGGPAKGHRGAGGGLPGRGY
jgi:hypothetical protein